MLLSKRGTLLNPLEGLSNQIYLLWRKVQICISMHTSAHCTPTPFNVQFVNKWQWILIKQNERHENIHDVVISVCCYWAFGLFNKVGPWIDFGHVIKLIYSSSIYIVITAIIHYLIIWHNIVQALHLENGKDNSDRLFNRQHYMDRTEAFYTKAWGSSFQDIANGVMLDKKQTKTVWQDTRGEFLTVWCWHYRFCCDLAPIIL